MQESVEHMYCSEQIEIPVSFPYILKVYAKAAIRTQPYDLLRWTSAYFRALANGEIPPVKKRLEYPPFSRPSGITPGYLKILFNQFNRTETVGIENLLARWKGVDLPESTLYQILMIGDFLNRDCPLFKFLAIGCGFLGNNLFETMIYICELLTDEPEGGSAMIPLKWFIDMYVFLASLDCSDLSQSMKSSEYDQSVEDEARSSPSRKIPDPSKVALPGSRRESENSTKSSLSVTDTITASLSQCGSEKDVEETLVNTCRRESASRLIEEKSVRHSRVSRISDRDEEFPAITRIGRSSSVARSFVDRVSTLSAGPRQNSTTPRTDQTSDDNTPRSNREDLNTKFVDNFDHDDASGQNYLEGDENFDVFEGYDAHEEAEEKGIKDMENYEPIGLETLLDGICECLEPAEEKRAETPPSPDPVEEFLERMHAAFPSPYVNLIVPGIGPSVPQDQITAVCLWLTDCARRQTGLVGPRNIRHFLCPALEVSSQYEDSQKTLFKCI